jgi:hypothetical protein
LRDDGVACAGAMVAVDADELDADGTVSIDVVAVVVDGAGDDGIIVGGAGDDSIIDERRLRDTVGGGGINNESSVMRGVGGACACCSRSCRALSVVDRYRGLL